MSDIIKIADHQPHEFFEVMCVKCLDRWIAVVRVGLLLKKIECRNCGPGFTINTGQKMD